MSSNYTTGQWVGTIVGAVVGFFTGGAGWAATASAMAAGASVGGAVGGAIDPPKGPKIVGPRLSDLSQQTSSYGTVIPRIYGSAAVLGNVFWIENNAIRETSNTTSSGGKGGGGGSETETFSYSATFALGLCEGPIAGVRRIWISGKLVYDAGSDDMGTIQASNTAASGFRLYTGSESQTPDSRIQATIGVANTPAYRGLAYIVFDDLQLADYGNTLLGAQIKVEVVASGATNIRAMTATNTGLGSAYLICWDGSQFIATNFEANTAYYSTSYDGLNWTVRNNTPAAGPNAGLALATKNGVTLATWSYQGGVFRTDTGRSWTKINTAAGNSFWGLASTNTHFVMYNREYDGRTFISDDGKSWDIGPTLPNPKSYSSKGWGTDGTRVALVKNGYAMVTVITPGNGSDTSIDSYPCPLAAGPVVIAYMANIGKWFMSTQGGQAALTPDFITWQTYTMPHAYGYVEFGDALYMSSNANFIKLSYDGLTWENVALPSAIGSDAFCYANGVGVVLANYGTSYRMVLSKLVGISPPLSQVISSEVVKSGLLSSGDIDAASLTDTVRGYRIASVAAIRSNLDPLQGAWPFDVVQSGYQIKFKRRAGSSVATIDAAMLGAMTDGKQEPRFTQTREMDSQLPYRVNLTYMDAGREYDQGEQYAERLNTDSINVRTIEMPIVLSSDEAAQKSEILLYMYWLDRYDVAFKLPPQYGYLEPADIITVNTENGTYSLRLTSVNYLSNGIVECSAKFNDNAVYTSSATTDTGTLPDGTITLPGPSIYVLLDIPLLLDAYDTSGFVVAMGGMTSSWSGGSVFKSADSGQTWAMINGFAAPSVIGSASNAIAAPDEYRMIDKESCLTVSLYGGQALSSVTELQMLNGLNHFAYGVDGRWEIIAAQNCDLQGDGTYILSDLLRGRFGSEWAMGSHAAGDGVVLLDPLRIQFAATNLNLIGANLDYRGVSAGQNINSVASSAFSYDGVNLECLAPVYLNGNRHPSTNDWSLEWIRRTRVGGEWRDYVDATLGEASEAYEVEIFSDGSYTTLKRTISGLTTPAATYSSANQVTDFGSNQATLYVKVYQLSANVGRGYPLIDSLYRALPDGDPLWEYVIIALHMNDDGLTDAKGHAVTKSGNVTRSSAQSKFGGYSAYFDGAGDRLAVPCDLSGTVDLTIEMFVNLVDGGHGEAYSRLFHLGEGNTTGALNLVSTLSNNPGDIFASMWTPSEVSIGSGSGALTNGVWYHVAIERVSNVWTFYLDGVPKGSATNTTNLAQTTLYIGANSTMGESYKGYIDEMRITKGAARYMGNFTPPTIPYADY